MTVNGIYTTFKNSEIGDDLWTCFTNIRWAPESEFNLRPNQRLECLLLATTIIGGPNFDAYPNRSVT